MGFNRRWKPSRTAAREFAQQMERIASFCYEHGIMQSAKGDSYYFEIDGKKYRVSNHTVERSNETQRERGGVIYHPEGRDANTVYITAGKTRIIEIYEAICAGKQLDGRGYVIGIEY